MNYKYLLLSLFFAYTSVYGQAPELTAVGDQVYCPLTSIPIATDFEFNNPGGTVIDALYIQISSGYEQGNDFLEFPNLNPNITQSFNAADGKLTLRFSSTITNAEIIEAVEAVTFRSDDASVSGKKEFSISIGQANYLPSSDHYYEYVPANLITWQDARIAAENRTYYGLQGYLATITTLDEAVLCGEQTQGAGWIGGTDEAVEGVWEWVTGPEGLAGGVEFWRGGPGGSTTTFAYWNPGEPNNTNGGEDYAHITAPGVGIEGSWNDLRTTGETNPLFQAKGYIVEYGGMPGDPVLKIAAATQIRIPVTSATGDSRCGPGVVTLDATTNAGELHWYDSQSGGNILFTGTQFTPNLTSSQTFYVAAEPAGCTSGKRRAVQAEILPEVVAPNQITFSNCDEDGTPDGFVDFNLQQIIPYLTSDPAVQVTFYSTRFDADTNSGSNVLTTPYNNASGSSIYAYIFNSAGCSKVSEVQLQVSTTSFPNGFSYNLTTCDTDAQQDGFMDFDLNEASSAMLNVFPSGANLEVSYFRSELDALLAQNEINTASFYRNEVAYTQIVYVRVEDQDSGGCYGVGPHLELQVEALPIFDVVNEGKFCSNASSFTLETENAQGVYNYSWYDASNTRISTSAQVTVTTPGIYTVIATTAYECTSEPKQIEVIASEAALLDLEHIEVIQENGSNNIHIADLSLLGIGDYEFALGDPIGPYQTDPTFDDVTIGLQTLYVRDQNGCGISSIEIPVLGFPKYFTPNNDGYHDTWGAQGIASNEFSAIQILIFNRFGKLLKTLYDFNSSWDGSTRGSNLPADDYWYKVLLTKTDGSIVNYQGHVTLKR